MTLKRLSRLFLSALLLGLGGYGLATIDGFGNAGKAGGGSGSMAEARAAPMAPGDRVAIFAGGCFWCMEHAMDDVAGVKSTTSGYTGGHVKNPTYAMVSSGGTGHAESVKVVYDPKVVTYAKLLDAFWHNIDPLVKDAQFCDHGTQYRSSIFYLSDEQKKLAEASKTALVKSGRFKLPIQTQIVKAGTFYPAEGYHQNYYLKNPIRYKYYKYACGRAQRLEQLWGPPAKKSS